MTAKIPKNVVERWDGNPVLSIDDLCFAASDVHNAGAVRHEGRCVLLVTVERLDGRCAIYRASSEDGRQFKIEKEPVLEPAKEGIFAPYEAGGVRDARITLLEGTYYIVYLAYSQYGFRLCLARTADFRSIERISVVSEPDTKNGVLFPRRIKGRFARLERPQEGGNIWISYSDDLVHWGSWDIVMTHRGGYWDSHRIGASVPPIETSEGWLLFYYGVKNTPGGPLFRLGAAFLDLEEPSRVLGRCNVPLLSPKERYERIGDVPNLVFACGAIPSRDGAEVDIYYGAADSCICLGSVSLDTLEYTCYPEKAREAL